MELLIPYTCSVSIVCFWSKAIMYSNTCIYLLIPSIFGLRIVCFRIAPLDGKASCIWLLISHIGPAKRIKSEFDACVIVAF